MKCLLLSSSLVVVVVLFASGAYAGGVNPTPAELVAAWNAMSGGLPAKVVYWRDVDGTDDGRGAICVLDLTTGQQTVVRSQLDMGGGNWKTLQQNAGAGGGPGPHPCWSPDGTRIYFFNIDNDWGHWVMNADGSNPKRVSSTWDDGGYWFASWYDNNSVVYNDIATNPSVIGGEIVRITLDANNNPVLRTVLIGDSAYGGEGRSYITAAGTYVAWTDGSANSPFGGMHRSVVRNFNGPLPPNQQEMEVIARDDDACDICIKPDGSGTAVYNHANHLNATAKTYQAGINPPTTLFVWSPVEGEEIHFLRWSQHPDYICYMDRRNLAWANQRSYIRKATAADGWAGTQWMFLGYGIWGADVWVDATGPDTEPPDVTLESVVIAGTVTDDMDDTATVTINGADVPVTGNDFLSEQVLSSSPEGVPVVWTGIMAS